MTDEEWLEILNGVLEAAHRQEFMGDAEELRSLEDGPRLT